MRKQWQKHTALDSLREFLIISRGRLSSAWASEKETIFCQGQLRVSRRKVGNFGFSF